MATLKREDENIKEWARRVKSMLDTLHGEYALDLDFVAGIIGTMADISKMSGAVEMMFARYEAALERGSFWSDYTEDEPFILAFNYDLLKEATRLAHEDHKDIHLTNMLCYGREVLEKYKSLLTSSTSS